MAEPHFANSTWFIGLIGATWLFALGRVLLGPLRHGELLLLNRGSTAHCGLPRLSCILKHLAFLLVGVGPWTRQFWRDGPPRLSRILKHLALLPVGGVPGPVNFGVAGHPLKLTKY